NVWLGSLVRPRYGERERHPGPAPVGVVDPDGAAHGLDQGAADEQAESYSDPALLEADELVEHPRPVLGRGPGPTVADREAHPVAVPRDADADRSLVRRELAGVDHKVHQDVLDGGPVGADRWQRLLDVQLEVVVGGQREKVLA